MQNPFKLLRPFIIKHEPELLMALGIGGLTFSIAWSIKASFNASRKIDNYKKSKQIEKITPKETFKLVWKDYLPVVISTAVSVPCIIFGNRVSNKRYAALAAAYTISETALQEYQETARAIVGDKKAKQIQETVEAKKVEETYKGVNQVILTGNGDSLFFEPLSGRYFTSNWNSISKAANELNAEALGSFGGQITLNDWFCRIGLEETDIGYSMGWDLNGDPTNLISIELSSHLTKDNIPCGSISYRKRPVLLN